MLRPRDAAALNGAKSVRANGSSDAGNAGRSAASSRSKRKLAVEAFILSEEDATYDSGIDVGGKGDLDISSVDDLDQVERFDLGDTLHMRGGRAEGSIVEELEEIYDTLRLDDNDSDVTEALISKPERSSGKRNGRAVPDQEAPTLEEAAEPEEALEADGPDLEESEPDAAELERADVEVVEVEHPEDLERFIDRVLSTDSVSVDDPVRIYLREIGRTALLKSPDESALAEKMTVGRKAQVDLAQLEADLKDEAGHAGGVRGVEAQVPGDHQRWRFRQAEVGAGQPAAGGKHSPPVYRARPLAARPDPGRQHRADEGCRQVRPPQGLQVLDIRHLVDPSGHHPSYFRPEPHDPLARARHRDGDTPAPRRARIAAEAACESRPRKSLGQALNMPAERVRKILDMARHPASLDAPMEEGEDSFLGDFIEDERTGGPEEEASRQMLKEQVDDILRKLTDRERQILQMRYGLTDDRPRTLEEVAKEFGITRERIRQIETRILRKLRYARYGASKLRGYLD